MKNRYQILLTLDVAAAINLLSIAGIFYIYLSDIHYELWGSEWNFYSMILFVFVTNNFWLWTRMLVHYLRLWGGFDVHLLFLFFLHVLYAPFFYFGWMRRRIRKTQRELVCNTVE